jgi:hypothetical protein
MSTMSTMSQHNSPSFAIACLILDWHGPRKPLNLPVSSHIPLQDSHVGPFECTEFRKATGCDGSKSIFQLMTSNTSKHPLTGWNNDSIRAVSDLLLKAAKYTDRQERWQWFSKYVRGSHQPELLLRDFINRFLNSDKFQKSLEAILVEHERHLDHQIHRLNRVVSLTRVSDRMD